MPFIKLDIDCTKIPKHRLKDGKYLKCVLRDKRTDKSDGFIAMDVSKEERESGVRGEIIGNFKVLGEGGQHSPRPASAPPRPQRPAPPKKDPDLDPESDCPF